MAEPLHFHFDVDGDNFTSAGAASVEVKRKLRQMGFPAETIRRDLPKSREERARRWSFPRIFIPRVPYSTSSRFSGARFRPMSA